MNVEISEIGRYYYIIIGNDSYLSEGEERAYIKFFSDSVLTVNSSKSIKVHLDELSIKYSHEGSGDFYTIEGQKLENHGVIGSDIYFQRLNSTIGEILHNATLTVQTIAKFGHFILRRKEFKLIFLEEALKM